MNATEQSFYPADLAAALRDRWLAAGHPGEVLPSDEALIVLLDRMYQASLLREEGEPVKCRIIVASPDAFAHESSDGADDLVVLRFTQPSALTPHDVRKLAAAAGYHRALLAVDVTQAQAPVIWGMVTTGTKGVNRFGGDRFDGAPLPPNLVLQSLSPGHLTAASGYERVFEAAGGKLLTEGFDPFRSNLLSGRFDSLRAGLRADLNRTSPNSGSTQLCDSFVRDVTQSVIRHVLSLVRSRGHGGMLVSLPAESGDETLADQWFRFRVRFAVTPSSLRFRSLVGRLTKRVLEVGGELGLPVCKWSDYRKMVDAEISELNNALVEFGYFLADLMNIDGAVVMDRELRLVGFGGEILGESHVSQINRACDLEANRVIVEPADRSGTRHRSAYRLVNGTREAIAVVVSQDGEVRFVAQHEGKLLYWPYLP